jgi:hypothetical protein
MNPQRLKLVAKLVKQLICSAASSLVQETSEWLQEIWDKRISRYFETSGSRCLHLSASLPVIHSRAFFSCSEPFIFLEEDGHGESVTSYVFVYIQCTLLHLTSSSASFLRSYSTTLKRGQDINRLVYYFENVVYINCSLTRPQDDHIREH